MAFLNAHPGSWTIGGYRLPDISATEWLGRQIAKVAGGYAPLTEQGGSSLRGPATEIKLAQDPYTQTVYNTTYTPPKQPPKKESSVLGTQTKSQTSSYSPPTSLPQTSQPTGQISSIMSEEERLRREYENRIRSAIESGYGETMRILDEIAGLVPERQAQEQQQLQQFLTTQTGALTTQKEGSLANLGLAEQQVEAQKKQAQEDIYSSLRNLLKASQSKLGLAGAGQSSASQIMLPYAMGKQAGQSLAQVQSQVIGQLNQIEMKKNDVKTTYDLAVNQLQQDYQEKLNNLSKTYNDYLDQIRLQKGNVSQQKAQALAALEEGLMNQAMEDARNLRNYFIQRTAEVDDWARQRMAQLDDYKIQLGQMGQFNPQQLTYRELQGLSGEMSPVYSSQGDLAAMLALSAARKKSIDELTRQLNP